MAKTKFTLGSAIFLLFLLVIVAGSFVAEVPLWISAILGFIVGIINITEKETMKTLLAGLIIIMGSGALIALGQIPVVGTYIGALFTNIATYFALVAVIVAIKEFMFAGKE